MTATNSANVGCINHRTIPRELYDGSARGAHPSGGRSRAGVDDRSSRSRRGQGLRTIPARAGTTRLPSPWSAEYPRRPRQPLHQRQPDWTIPARRGRLRQAQGAQRLPGTRPSPGDDPRTGRDDEAAANQTVEVNGRSPREWGRLDVAHPRTVYVGRSPRGRGRRAPHAVPRLTVRTIPARAGTTPSPPGAAPARRGRSPRGRGRRAGRRRWGVEVRTIPARGATPGAWQGAGARGTTPCGTGAARSCPDDPRAGGDDAPIVDDVG